MDELLHNFLAILFSFLRIPRNGAKDNDFGKLFAISRNSGKISEIFNEKSAISVKFQQHSEKVCKNHQNMRISENFEMQAVQKSVYLVELEKFCKM